MQIRHLRYFVKIIDAGSFSRAAAAIHVAQPALSQQIAELEQELGVQLLQRTPRGVTPTAAGEVLYREAAAIIKQVERLPGIVRSSGGEPEGSASVGLSVVLGASLTGPMIAAVREALPRVSLRFANADSKTLIRGVESRELDLALVYEDEPAPEVARQPLFRHRMYLVSYQPVRPGAAAISLRELAAVPLILPPRPHLLRSILDRACAAAHVSLNVAAEVELTSMSSVAAAMKSGAAGAILPNSDLLDLGRTDWAQPLPIEPPLYANAALIWSREAPLTQAAEALRLLFIRLLENHVKRTALPGAEWVGPQSAASALRRAEAP